MLVAAAISATVGVIASSSHLLLVGAGGLGLTVLVIGTILYVKDPVLALMSLWVVILFTGPLSAVVGYTSSAGEAVRQTDELLVALFAMLTLLRVVQSGVPPLLRRFIVPVVGVTFCGVASAALHQVPLGIGAVGLWLGLKLWVMVLIALCLPWQPTDVQRIYRLLTCLGLLVAIFGIGDLLTHSALSRTLHTARPVSETTGFRSSAVQSFLNTPGEYSLLMSLLFAVTFARFSTSRHKADLLLALCFAVSAILSLRLKGVLSLTVVLLLVSLVPARRHRRGVTVVLIGVLVLTAAVAFESSVISKQISTYGRSESSPRAVLYSTGEHIAVDDFPLGEGFGRFASYPSRLHYSPVYFKYHVASVWGLSPQVPNFIDDTSWPSILGETGIAGTCFYAFGVVLLASLLFRRSRDRDEHLNWVALAALCALGVILVDSLGDPTLFDWLPTGAFALILGPALIQGAGSGDP